MNLGISWHDKAWEKYINARVQQRLPHALLITGLKGVGKSIFAKKMVKSLLCINNSNNFDACKQCRSCKTYNSGANPDYLEVKLLEGKQQISVDQIRQLSEFLNHTRSFDSYRVVLIEPVERMNRNAANSLLKCLEEPSNNTVIILVAENMNSVLPTIKSRCHRLPLPLPSRKTAISWLKERIKDSDNLEELLIISNDSPLIALDIPDNLVKLKNDFENDLSMVISERKSVTETAKKWEKHNHSELINWQIISLQKLIKNRVTSQKTNDTTNTENSLLSIMRQVSAQQLWLLYESIISQKHYVHTSVNSLMFIENMIMLWQCSKNNNN